MLDDKVIEELRPVAHQHMAMLTSSGVSPATALAIAAHVCALVHSACFDEALREAFASISAGANDEMRHFVGPTASGK